MSMFAPRTPYEAAWQQWNYGGGGRRGEPMPRPEDFPPAFPAAPTRDKFGMPTKPASDWRTQPTTQRMPSDPIAIPIVSGGWRERQWPQEPVVYGMPDWWRGGTTSQKPPAGNTIWNARPQSLGSYRSAR